MPLNQLCIHPEYQTRKLLQQTHRLTLEAVVKAENIQVADEEVEKELQEMADAYKMELEKVKSFMGENELAQIKEDLAVQKAVDLLVKEAKLA